MTKSIDLILPWPPSVNHYWMRSSKGMFISQKGKAYRELVIYSSLKHKYTFNKNDRLNFYIIANPPDSRRRDLDNILKSLLDALQHALVYEDDNQIDKLLIERGSQKEGTVIVKIEELKRDFII